MSEAPVTPSKGLARMRALIKRGDIAGAFAVALSQKRRDEIIEREIAAFDADFPGKKRAFIKVPMIGARLAETRAADALELGRLILEQMTARVEALEKRLAELESKPKRKGAR